MEKVTEAAVSTIPFVGGPLAVVFATAVGWSISKRTEDWLAGLADEVERLGLVVEDLAPQPAFVDAVVTATRAAQATHQQEKLDALRNGVLHSIGPDAPALDEQARFFRLVEQFTAGHLQLLAFLDDPAGLFDRLDVPRPQMGMGSRAQLAVHLPGFQGRPEWVALLFSDVSVAQLTNSGPLGTTMTGDGLWQQVTTPLGRRFLAFIAPSS